jgi:pantothenate kinase
VTFLELVEANAPKQSIRERVALRWLARRCRRDADFAAAFEEEVTNQLVTHQAKIDWSQIDWEQVVKIVMMILAAFGVL